MITKGPWELHQYESSGRYYIRPKNPDFLEVIGDCLTNKGDAQAIAAVPDLIQAMKDLTKEIHLSKYNIKKDFSLINAHAQALKALYKAGVQE